MAKTRADDTTHVLPAGGTVRTTRQVVDTPYKGQGESSSLEAIAMKALLALRDPDASAEEAKAKAEELFPEATDRVANPRNWAATISKVRDRASFKLGVPRKRRKSPVAAASGPIGVQDVARIGEIVGREYGGEAERCREVLKVFQSFGTIAGALEALDGWERAVEVARSPEGLPELLQMLHSLGSLDESKARSLKGVVRAAGGEAGVIDEVLRVLKDRGIGVK